MKNMLKNKKGFTLVELLAVIVILSLLIIITMNTVLPMLGGGKKSGMKVYAGKVFNTAITQYQTNELVGVETDLGVYSIAELMKTSEYFGCVKLTKDPATDAFTYSIQMYSNDNKLKIVTETAVASSENLKAVDYATSDFTSGVSNYKAENFDNVDKCSAKMSPSTPPA